MHEISSDQAHLSIQWRVVLQEHSLLLLVADCGDLSTAIWIHLIDVRDSRLGVTRPHRCIFESGHPLGKLPGNLINHVALALGIVRQVAALLLDALAQAISGAAALDFLELHVVLFVRSPVPTALAASCGTIGCFLDHGGGDGRRQDSDWTSLLAATQGVRLRPHL